MNGGEPNDLIPMKEAEDKTRTSRGFFLIAAAKGEISLYRPSSIGMIAIHKAYVQVFLNNGQRPVQNLSFISRPYITDTESLYLSEIEAIMFSQNRNIKNATALEKLMICDVGLINAGETSRQQKEGFEIWKKQIAKRFQQGVRAAGAIIAYCHQQNKKLRLGDLQDIIARPEDFEGTEALVKYKGLTNDLIQDIYTELPPQYRYARGEKMK